MSTLTKILAALFVVATLLLCGATVTYVANADSYKGKYEDLNKKYRSAKDDKETTVEQYNELESRLQQTEKDYSRQLTSLNDELKKAKSDLREAERKNTELIQQVSGFASQIETFRDTNAKKTELLDKTLEELKTVEAKQLNQKKELEQTTAELIEKMAIIETLETAGKRYQEEKSELQEKLDRVLQKTGKTFTPEAVTSPEYLPKETKTAARRERDLSLRGQVSEIDLKNSLASISMGTSDGVREGMTFHVTRGSEFICDILIIETDTDESVGVLELVQQPPRIGDHVSTNL